MLDLYRFGAAIWIWLFLVLASGGAEAATQLDSTFGLNGRVAVELGQHNGGHAALVQVDGKVIVAGSSSNKQNGLRDFTLLRLDQNGQLDPGFNQEGYVITSLVAGDDEALALGQLSDGRLVVGGYSFNGKDRDFALVCFLPDGRLDVQFGDNGAVLSAIGNSHEEITALVVDSADRIVVVGDSQGTTGKILVAARYLTNGELDRSFGEDGLVLLGVGDDANGEEILLLSNGAILLAGSYVEQHKQTAMLVGLISDGSLNVDFGKQGVVSLADTVGVSEGYGLAQDSTGLIYLAGAVGKVGERKGALFRFTANGAIDFDFGQDGVMLVGQGTEDEVLYDVVAHGAGLSAAGFSTIQSRQHFLLASLQPPADSVLPSEQGMNVQDLAPVQEIRINENTRVQIRKLQIWTNEMLLQRKELLQSLLKKSSAHVSPPEQKESFSFRLVRWMSPPVAHAGPSNDFLPGNILSGNLELQTLVTDFGGLEAVCHGLSVAPDGQIVAVGTAGGEEISAVIAARYTADDIIDRRRDVPGHRSRYITTLPSTEVTQTSLTTGGEISDSFPKDVVRRGVLFSLKPGQAYEIKKPVAATNDLLPRLRSLGDVLIPEVVAAESAPAQPPVLVSAIAQEEGITDNGPGRGIFYARLEHLLPSSVYYIRAYAMTADGAIYYGDQVSVRTADACFIATASFGTLLHPCVQVLRDFRDVYLMPSAWGRKVVHVYYTLSPPFAACIAQQAGLRFVVRLLLFPGILFSWLAVHLGLFTPLVLVVSVPCVLLYLRRRQRHIVS